MRTGKVVAAGLAIIFSSKVFAGAFWLTDFVLPDSWALGIEPELILDSDSGLGIQAHFKKGFTDLVNGSVFAGTGDSKKRFRAGGELIFDLFPEGESQPGIGFAAHGSYYRRLHADPAMRAVGQKQGVLELTVIPYVHKSFLSGIKTREVAAEKKSSVQKPRSVIVDDANKKTGATKKSKEPAVEEIPVADQAQENGSASDRVLDPYLAIPIGWNFIDNHYQPMAQFILGVVMKSSSSFHYYFELDMPIQHSHFGLSGGVAYFY